LDEVDGWRALRLLNLKYWRDVASAFKEDPKSVTPEQRIRIHQLLRGREDALTYDMEEKSYAERQVGKVKKLMQEAGADNG